MHAERISTHFGSLCAHVIMDKIETKERKERAIPRENAHKLSRALLGQLSHGSSQALPNRQLNDFARFDNSATSAKETVQLGPSDRPVTVCRDGNGRQGPVDPRDARCLPVFGYISMQVPSGESAVHTRMRLSSLAVTPPSEDLSFSLPLSRTDSTASQAFEHYVRCARRNVPAVGGSRRSHRTAVRIRALGSLGASASEESPRAQWQLRARSLAAESQRTFPGFVTRTDR